MEWYPFSNRDYLLLVAIFFITWLFAQVQQSVVPASLRVYTYLCLVLILLIILYLVIKPVRPMQLAVTLSALLGGIVAFFVVVGQMLIRHIYSYEAATLVAGAFLCPLIAGYFYRVIAWCAGRCRRP